MTGAPTQLTINMAASKDRVGSNRCKILIIGAGMAGLSAAHHLVKNGVTDFKILEARRRIGGRIVSIPTDHHRVELGANWIHGVLGNPMYELAMTNGLIDIVHVPKPHRVVAATEDGKLIPFQLLQEIYEAYVCFLRRCEEYFLCHYLPPAGVHSVGEHINLEAALYLDHCRNPEERQIRQLIFDCLLKRETCITGCHSMDEIDLLELGSYTELQGGNIVLPSGYSSILEPIAKVIPPQNIVTGKPVATVRWNCSNEMQLSNMTSPGGDSGIDILANGDPGNDSDDSDRTVTGDFPKFVEHSSREGSCEAADKKSSTKSQCSAESGESSGTGVQQSTVNSASGQCSQQDDSENSDSCVLPPSVEIVCDDGDTYYADHVICTVPLGVLKERASTMFCPPLPQYKTESINRLLFGTVDKIFLEYDRPFLNPDISELMLLWKSDAAENGNEDSSDLSKCWFRKIYSFSKVSETLLLGWISGKEAEYMETLAHEEVAEKCTEILRKFLNDPFVPKPKLCVCTSWRSQPYTRGSYTAMAVGASQVDIENIARSLYASSQEKKPVLLFAGEHTHSSFYSTVHGAYLTGRSAAQVLLDPDSPEQLIMQCEGTSDLSSWIQGISLD
ncbi:spermine oxidase [Schistocerca piceifrons]|uniref:spermine oxidase n=1 Tax=Schistocerca piceifrons TaxID=274613 RepID=UPI001F5F92A7|nr:spermine oxidase [Schistocerca piceifrons]